MTLPSRSWICGVCAQVHGCIRSYGRWPCTLAVAPSPSSSHGLPDPGCDYLNCVPPNICAAAGGCCAPAHLHASSPDTLLRPSHSSWPAARASPPHSASSKRLKRRGGCPPGAAALHRDQPTCSAAAGRLPDELCGECSGPVPPQECAPQRRGPCRNRRPRACGVCASGCARPHLSVSRGGAAEAS